MNRLGSVLALALLLPLAACGGDDDSTGPDGDSIVGVWAATVMEGESLPITETFSEGGISCTFTLSAVDLNFAANGAFTVSDTSSLACTGMPAENTSGSESGTYSVSGNLVTVTFMDENNEPDSETHRFTISGNTLTVYETSTSNVVVVVAQRK